MVFRSVFHFLGATAALVAASFSNGATKAKALAGAACFTENKGQWDPQALYLSRMNDLNLWVTEDGLVFEFPKVCPKPCQ